MFKKKNNKDDKNVIEEEKRDHNPNKPSSHSGASESETKEIEELISEIDVPDKNQEPEKNTTQVVASIPQNSVPISNHLEAQKTTSLQSTIFASKPEQVSPQIEILSTKSENKEDPLNKRLTEAYEKLESMANDLDSLQTN